MIDNTNKKNQIKKRMLSKSKGKKEMNIMKMNLKNIQKYSRNYYHSVLIIKKQ